jgi:hypothetical protein
VTTPAGTSASSAADLFTYRIPPPVVGSINPAIGSTAGGTYVTISGSNLAGASGVAFGASAGTILSASGTEIVAAAPARAAGTVDVTVSNAGGPSATGSFDRYAYSASANATVSAQQYVDANDQPTNASISAQVTVAAGNLIALAIEEKYPTSPTDTAFSVTSVSGGGVSSWQRAIRDTPDGHHGDELWYGTVTSGGSYSIDVTTDAGSGDRSDPQSATSLDVQVFGSSAGASATWKLDQTGEISGDSSPDYPTLTPSGSAEVYFGYLATGVAQAGSTPQCVYTLDQRSNQTVYQPSVSATIQPSAGSDSGGSNFSLGMLLYAVP